jgi:PAS domain S-box-containing protein
MPLDSGNVLDVSIIAARLAAIVESSDDIIIGKTLDGTITSWNPAAERILGYVAAEAIGQSIKLIIPPDRWDEEDIVLAHIRRGKKVEHFETVRRAKDGRLLNLSLTVSPIRDDQGRIVGASKIARNITDRIQGQQERDRLLVSEKKARRQAEEARIQAEEANRRKDEFLAVVSHELRSPLSAITGWASLMRSGKLDREETARAAETILRNAQLQTQLISDLLDVSAIVSDRLRLNIRPFTFGSVIKEALEVVRPAAQAKSIRLEFSMDPTVGPVAGDPDRLQQVCWNLFSNAVKFTPIGGAIQVRVLRTNSSLKVVVSDNGKGIPPHLLSPIFERFRQGDSSTTREHGGLGLGLAIVRHLVELHGGEVKARSEGPGKGAEFVVELPIFITRRSAESLEQDNVDPRAVDGTVPSLIGLRILAVDDEPDALGVVSAILGSAGAEVKTATSVSQAVDLINQWRPDVLISDIGMPDEDGYELIRKVRARPSDKQKNIPAIALTAFARAQDRLKVLSAGYQMHVPKPIEPLELITVVASVTNKL